MFRLSGPPQFIKMKSSVEQYLKEYKGSCGACYIQDLSKYVFKNNLRVIQRPKPKTFKNSEAQQIVNYFYRNKCVIESTLD